MTDCNDGDEWTLKPIVPKLPSPTHPPIEPSPAQPICPITPPSRPVLPTPYRHPQSGRVGYFWREYGPTGVPLPGSFRGPGGSGGKFWGAAGGGKTGALGETEKLARWNSASLKNFPKQPDEPDALDAYHVLYGFVGKVLATSRRVARRTGYS